MSWSPCSNTTNKPQRTYQVYLWLNRISYYSKIRISSSHQLQGLDKNEDPFQFLMKQVLKLKKLDREKIIFLAREILDVGNNVLTCEMQSDQEILLLATQPLSKTQSENNFDVLTTEFFLTHYRRYKQQHSGQYMHKNVSRLEILFTKNALKTFLNFF